MTSIRYLTPRHVVVAAAVLFAALACGNDDAPVAPRRVLTTINVSLGASAIEVGEFTGATALAFDQDGAPIDAGQVTWTSETPTIAAVNPASGLVFAIAPGTTSIVATTPDGKTGSRLLTVAKAPAVRINEVFPNGETQAGWVEFFNPTSVAVDLSGWKLIDSNFFGPEYVFPAGSVVPAGGFLVTEEAALPFGIDALDALHLFSRFGVHVDGASWPMQTSTTLGVCPDGGSAALIATLRPTKGSANACP
jgi:hypothetical protein